MEAFHHMVPLSVFLVGMQNKTIEKKAHNNNEEIITKNNNKENTHINLNYSRTNSQICPKYKKIEYILQISLRSVDQFS